VVGDTDSRDNVVEGSGAGFVFERSSVARLSESASMVVEIVEGLASGRTSAPAVLGGTATLSRLDLPLCYGVSRIGI
jgi:hypothetical protein